jgi:predicted oxidoreductase
MVSQAFKYPGSTMQMVTLGQSRKQVSRLSYGTMRISGTWDPNALTPELVARGKASLMAAYDAGYTLFDHADIYGRHTCEQIHGELFAEQPELRDRTFLATKCSIRWAGEPSSDDPHRYDLSADWIMESVECSLQRLRTDRIDLLQLHRPDVLLNPHEVADAFRMLKSHGKVLHFGVSNFQPSLVSMLTKWLGEPLAVNQVQIHMSHLHTFTDGTLDQCLELGISPLAWSPLGGGKLFAADHQDQPLQLAVHSMARKYETTPANIALAWLMKHPSGIIPVIGSTNPERIKEMVKATEIELTRSDWYVLYTAARGEKLP